MRGIPEDKAIEIGEQIDSCKYLECSVKEWLRDECQELQEPWMTLEEFFKSGFEGWCWIAFDHGAVHMSLYQCNEFYFNADTDYTYCKETILKVQPIHKPEPPR